MLALTLFRAITFAKQLPLSILCATRLLGALVAHCIAQTHRITGIVPPRPESLKENAPLAAFD